MRGAAADARALLTRAIDAAEQAGDIEVEARTRVARGRAHDALTAYPAALGDFQLAADLARKAGDRRLEMIALRELGGDVPVALGIAVSECGVSLRRALALAEVLGDHATESDVLARLAVIASNGLNFVESLSLGRRAVLAAQASDDHRALAVALDGQKNGYAYLGELESLMPIVAELEPLLRQQGDLWRLPWTIQETAFADLAAGAWDKALGRISTAREVNLQSGYLAYDAWFVSQLAWVHRLAGDIEEALACAVEADAQTRGSVHAWWRTAACEQLGRALLASGDREAAIELLSEGRERANLSGAEAFHLRCVAPLAEITGDPALLDEADALVRSILAPAGTAWLLGAEAYLSVARSWLRRGVPERARATVAPLLEPARRNGWLWVHNAAAEI
jgi:tetratricopeptide (TPR) repeat protein